jgi:hypothetical protein
VACCAGREFRIIVVVPDELEESPFTMPIHYFTRRTLLQDAPLGGIFSAYSPLFHTIPILQTRYGFAKTCLGQQ